MKTRYYVAYGSNLSEEQMKVRCPDAKPVGIAELADMKLVFRYHATVEPCVGETVPVLVWKISMFDERSLDMYEGFPAYYRKEELQITITDFNGNNPKKVKAMIYIMNGGEIEKPMYTYYKNIRNAYTRFGFNAESLEEAYERSKKGLW